MLGKTPPSTGKTCAGAGTLSLFPRSEADRSCLISAFMSIYEYTVPEDQKMEFNVGKVRGLEGKSKYKDG